MEESGESPRALHFAEWWPKPSRSNLARRSKQRVPRSSSHCPRGQEWIAWVTLCERSQTWTQTPLSSRLMVWGPTIMSSKVLVGEAVGGSWAPSSVCHSRVQSIPNQAVMCVWRGEVGRRHEVQQHEGGEQGDPLMPLLFSLATHNALKKRSGRCWMARNCSPFWTMCTSCDRQQGLDFCTIWLGRS